jgi:hypothetical protein
MVGFGHDAGGRALPVTLHSTETGGLAVATATARTRYGVVVGVRLGRVAR